MTIRDAHPDDLPAIARVQVETWRTTYRAILPEEFLAGLCFEKSEARFEQAMQRRGCIFLVAEDPNCGIVGFANGGPERTHDPVYGGELYAMYLVQAHQRRGIGRRLLGQVAARLASMGLHSMLVWVLIDNPACRFYEKLGAKRLRTQPIDIGGNLLQEVAYGWTELRFGSESV